jgi:hypothetical protein
LLFWIIYILLLDVFRFFDKVKYALNLTFGSKNIVIILFVILLNTPPLKLIFNKLLFIIILFLINFKGGVFKRITNKIITIFFDPDVKLRAYFTLSKKRNTSNERILLLIRYVLCKITNNKPY